MAVAEAVAVPLAVVVAVVVAVRVAVAVAEAVAEAVEEAVAVCVERAVGATLGDTLELGETLLATEAVFVERPVGTVGDTLLLGLKVAAEAEGVGVAGQTGFWNPWILMPNVLGRADQVPPPRPALVVFQPPLEPSQVVENTPELGVCAPVARRERPGPLQVVEAKERAMA